VRLRTLAATVALVATGVISSAESVALNPVADTTLLGSRPTNNLGRSANLLSGTVMNGARNRALLRFDPAGRIPPGSSIRSVKLVLTVVATSAPEAEYGLHRMQVEWTEGTGTGNQGQPAKTGDPTFTHHRFDTVAWHAPGATAPEDYAAMPGAVATAAGPGPVTFSGPGLVADVQSWLDAPAGNFGWLILCRQESRNSSRRFASREDTKGRQPVLVVEHTPPKGPKR
jgi:hypothetical protein